MVISRLLLILCCLAASMAPAQNKVLVFENKAAGNHYLIKKGDRLTFSYLSGPVRTERINQITDSTIVLDGTIYYFSEISVTEAHKRGKMVASRVFNVVGNGLAITGEVVAVSGFHIIGEGNGYGILIGTGVSMAGAVLWGSGFVFRGFFSPFTLSHRPLRTSDGWSLRVADRSEVPAVFDELYQ